jgi:hypothetical protein
MCKKITVLMCVIIAALAGNIFAGTQIYTEYKGIEGGDWNTAANWSNGVPQVLDPVGGPQGTNFGKAGFKATQSDTSPGITAGITVGVDQIVIGSQGTVQGGHLTIAGGTINVSEYVRLGNATNGSPLSPETGTLNMTNGTLNCGTMISSQGCMYIGYSGVGTLNMNGGTINLTSFLSLADQYAVTATAHGTVNLNGGTINCASLKMNGGSTIIVKDGLLVITGNRTASGDGTLVPWLGTLITPYSGYTLQAVYDGSSKTTVSAYTVSAIATNPNPTNGATNTALNPTLSWTAGSGTTSHDVYFGTATSPPFIGNQTGTTYTPGSLAPATTYYWRIDGVLGSSTATGTVWSFTTAAAKAVTPNPSNGATGTALNATLSWTAGPAAASHDVYFGTTSPGAFCGNQTGTSFSPGALSANATYYWRIDEKDGSGNLLATGDVWSFTTGNPPPVNPYLSWRNDPTNSIVINWWNPFAAGDSTVAYGTTSSYGSTVTVPATAKPNFHHVELTGLTPSTTYHYKISSSDGTNGTDKTFTTADTMADANTFSFSFAMYGDPRGTQSANEPYYSRHQAVCDWIAAQGYKFALETGDIVWGGGISAANPLTAQGYYQDFYNLERNLAGSKVIMATMGNHEVQPVDAGGTVTYIYYYDLYTGAFPTNGPAADGKGRVYSFNYGNAHFVSLSSFQIDVTAQKNWLIADLTAARANPNIKWVFVMMHAPLYTTNGHVVAQSMIDAWAPVFEAYGVDIVFGGHNHCYERSYPIRSGQVAADGHAPIYLTNGMGGAEFNSTLSSPLFAASYGSQSLGAQTVVTGITISGLHLSVNTIANATGVPVDSFTLEKTPPITAGDFNADGTVDMKDLGIFSQSWLNTGIWP